MTSQPEPNKVLTAESAKLLTRGDLCLTPHGPDIVWDVHGDEVWFAVDKIAACGYLADRLTFIGRPDAEGWIPWSGGENPVPGLKIEYRMRGTGPLTTHSDNVDWHHRGAGAGDIIAFRLSPQKDGEGGLGETAPLQGSVPTEQTDEPASPVQQIISDEAITRVHGNANFGSMSPREVVNDGVRKYAVGYSGGHTQVCILREHGLITKPRGWKADLTEKGKAYARALGWPDLSGGLSHPVAAEGGVAGLDPTASVPAPADGQVAPQREPLGRTLYEAFWKRNGGNEPAWCDQSSAIRNMWDAIADDARQASPADQSSDVSGVVEEKGFSAFQKLAAYAYHSTDCAVLTSPSTGCTCGFVRVLNEALAQAKRDGGA